MSQSTSNQQANPTVIWQSLWAELFKQTLAQMNNCKYYDAFKSLLDLKELLPPECVTDTEAIYKEGEQLIFYTKATSYFANNIERDIRLYLNEKAPPMIRRIIGAITKSLYIHHWINKDTGFGADANGESQTF